MSHIAKLVTKKLVRMITAIVAKESLRALKADYNNNIHKMKIMQKSYFEGTLGTFMAETQEAVLKGVEKYE